MIQSRVKAYLKRKWYRRLRASVPPVQRWWRVLLAVWEKCKLQRTRVRLATCVRWPLCVCVSLCVYV